jgi:hypothetical protein
MYCLIWTHSNRGRHRTFNTAAAIDRERGRHNLQQAARERRSLLRPQVLVFDFRPKTEQHAAHDFVERSINGHAYPHRRREPANTL